MPRSLCIENFHRIPRRALTRELEENLLEPSSPRGLVAQILNRSDTPDLPLLDDRDAVAQRLRDFERVRGHHDGVAALHVFAEQILENARRLRIEADHWLVDHHHFRSMNERARDDQLLPHPVTVALDQLVGPFLQIEQRHQLATAVLDLVAILAVQSRHEAEEFRAGQLFVDERTVGNETQLRFCGERILGEIDSREVNGARRWLENSRDHAKSRRLARAIGAQESEQLTVGHGEINGINGCERAVFLGQTLELNHLVLAFAFLNAISKAVRRAERLPARAATIRPSASTHAVTPSGAPSMRQARTVSRCAGVHSPAASIAALSTTVNSDSARIVSSGRITSRVVGSNTDIFCVRPIVCEPPSMNATGARDGVNSGRMKV